MPPAADDLAWYVAYGSNLSRHRLMAYLCGTSGLGRYGAHRGCTDATPPRADRWVELDRRVRFLGTSPRWGGGVAFLDRDPTPGHATEARAWLLTVAQVLGVVAQEARLEVDPPPSLLDEVAPGATAPLGAGRYDTLLHLGHLDGRPALTVTTSHDLPEAPPAPAYLATIAAGRAERPAAASGGRLGL